MKHTLCVFALLMFVFALSSNSFACDPVGNPGCVTSFTLAPGEIYGDNLHPATATVTATIPSGQTGHILEIRLPGNMSIGYVCAGTTKLGPDGQGTYAGGCADRNATGTVNYTIQFSGYNATGTAQNGTITAVTAYAGTTDPGIPASLTVDPIPTPGQSVDMNCCDGTKSCGTCAGSPINVTNGNTFITQRDYSIPGLAGGLTLSRTWNSLWSLSNPPEQSGIFGDSWRSTFEERIQSLGSIANYWKDSGSWNIYQCVGTGCSWQLLAPANDQTVLSFNSGTSQWTIAEQNGTVRTFNSAGYLISIADRNGNTISINVDAANQNRIATVTDAAGRVLTFNYTTPGFPRLCSSISDSVGTFTTYQYDTSGKLTQVVYPDGSQYNFAYNSGTTLISEVTDSQLKRIEYHTYDSSRRGVISQLANDSTGQPVEQIHVYYQHFAPYQNLVEFNEGANGSANISVSSIAQRNYPAAATGSLYACATCSWKNGATQLVGQSGYPLVTTDPNGNSTYFTYDTQGNVLTRGLPRGSSLTPPDSYDIWTYTYNSFGQVLTTSDPLASAPGDLLHTTTNNYDTHGNLLSVTSPKPDANTAASQTVFTYNTNGTVKTIQDPDGNVTNMTYWPSGLVKTVKDANLKTTTYTYDGRGNLLSIQDPVNGSTKLTSFTYDLMNRVLTTTYPGATAAITFHYDWRGRRDWVQDQNGNKTTNGYDDADRLISVTDAQSPNPGVTRYTYDTDNHLTDIYDASNDHTHFTYTNGNTLASTDFPSGFSETYLPNNIPGMINRKTDRKVQIINYTYDHQNRLVQKAYPDSTTVQYTYDPAGRMTQVQDPTGTYSFTYDNMNRLTQTTTAYAFLTARNFTVQYTYDAASNRKGMTDPEQGGYVYTYDVLNRLKNIQDFQQLNYGFGYDNLSRRNSLTRPNGINTTYAYDPQSRLTSILHKLGTTTLDGATYTYDNAGNRLTRTDKRTNVTLSYTSYDNIYELQTVKQGATTKESYTYDPVGNRLTSLGVSPYTYNSSNWLTSIPGTTYNYDNNGSLTSKSDGTAYNWDFENRLTQVTLPGSGGTVNFKYDPFGRRIQKAFTQGSTTTTNYVYDGANAIEEVDANGVVLARYTHGLRIDEPLAELRSSTTSYYDADGLGSITSLSNSAGALANTYTYDSFGKLTASSGTIINPFQYTARDYDPETGLRYYRARYYDQNVGRFMSEDPIRFRGGINLYDYVSNNPVRLRDPGGTEGTPSGSPILCNCWLVSGLVRASGCSYVCYCSDEGILLYWYICPFCSKNALKPCLPIAIVRTSPGNGPATVTPIVPSDPCNGSV